MSRSDVKTVESHFARRYRATYHTSRAPQDHRAAELLVREAPLADVKRAIDGAFKNRRARSSGVTLGLVFCRFEQFKRCAKAA